MIELADNQNMSNGGSKPHKHSPKRVRKPRQLHGTGYTYGCCDHNDEAEVDGFKSLRRSDPAGKKADAGEYHRGLLHWHGSNSRHDDHQQEVDNGKVIPPASGVSRCLVFFMGANVAHHVILFGMPPMELAT